MKAISIPEEVYGRIAEIASKYDTPPEKILVLMLNAQITLALQSNCFYPGQKFGMPQETFVQARLFQTDLSRLQKWLQDQDRLELLVAGKNELFIFNGSK